MMELVGSIQRLAVSPWEAKHFCVCVCACLCLKVVGQIMLVCMCVCLSGGVLFQLQCLMAVLKNE